MVLFVITIHHQVYDLNVDIWFTIHQYNIKIILIIYDLRYDLGMNIWECLPDYYYFQCSNCIFEIFMHFIAKLGSCKHTTCVHWPCYCTVHVYVVIHMISVWSCWGCRIVLFVNICINKCVSKYAIRPIETWLVHSSLSKRKA